MTLRDSRVPWAIPNSRGVPSCPLCGLSARRFHYQPEERLAEHIRSAHAHCKACGFVTRPRYMARHTRLHHHYPTMVLPGLEHVA